MRAARANQTSVHASEIRAHANELCICACTKRELSSIRRSFYIYPALCLHPGTSNMATAGLMEVMGSDDIFGHAVHLELEIDCRHSAM